MQRVIDTISISDRLRHNVPEMSCPFSGDGLMVILDPSEQTDVLSATGRRALIVRPDGTSIEWRIAGVEVRHGVPALFFEGLVKLEVPRLSKVRWE
jgi:hypothetical protein